MAKFQIWGFTYLADSNGINVITGDNEECNVEFEIPCFNGVAFFKANNRHYIMKYPKIQALTNKDKETIQQYCGYIPESGEYGVICGALGQIIECHDKVFKSYCKAYQLPYSVRQRLGY